MVLSGTNTYSGITYVGYDGGTLELSGNGTILNSSAVEIRQAGRLKIVNAPGSNIERINDLATINLYGGTLEFQAAAGVTSDRDAGHAGPGRQPVADDRLRQQRRHGAADVPAVAGRSRPGPALNFVAKGSNLGSATNKVQFMLQLAGHGRRHRAERHGHQHRPAGSISPRSRATAAGFEVLALDNAAYKTDINTAGPADNVRLAAGTYTLTSSRTINSLVLEAGATLNMAGYTLAVQGANGLAGLILGNGA